MSQQCGPTLETFAQILCSLTDPNNNVRQAAEHQIQCLPPDQQIWYLVNIALSGSQNVTLRMLSYVSLKVLIVKHEGDGLLSKETIEMCKNSFIKIIMMEPEKVLRKKMVYTICALISHLSDGEKSSWPEMVDFVLQLLFSDNAVNRELSLNIISNAPFLFGTQIEEMVGRIHPKLVECLNYFVSDPSLAILTMEAIGSLTQYCNAKFVKDSFSVVAPVLIHVISKLAFTNSSTELFECLTEMADYSSLIFSKHLDSLVSVLLSLLNQPACNEHVDSIFEIIVSVAENDPKRFQQQASKNIPYIIKYAFFLLSQISDDDLALWLQTIGENEDEISNDLLHRSTTGEISLDRLARCLDKQLVLDLVLQEVDICLSTDNWRSHNAAIVSIGAIAEGCKPLIKKILPNIVDKFLPYFHADNPRIVFSCLNTYGQLAIDFAKHFHTNYHQKVFPAILSIAANHPYIKVQTNAILAFGNLIDGCKRKILRIYSKDIFFILLRTIEKIGQNLNLNGAKHILSICLSAVGSLASSFGESFEYYDSLMTLTWSMLNLFASINYIELYNEMLDCSLNVLDAIGPEKAFPYLSEIMKRVELLSDISRNTNRAEEFRLSYFKCLEKVCCINSEEISPRLSRLLAELMSYFQNDLKDSQDFSVSDQLAAEVVGNDASKIKTGIQDDQSIVCSLLSKLAVDLKHQMVQFLPQIMPIIVQVFQKIKSEELVCDLAECITDLLAVSKLSGTNNLMEYWMHIKNVFFIRFYFLKDSDCIVQFLETIESLVSVTEQYTMDQEQLVKFGNFIRTQIDCIFAHIYQENDDSKSHKIDEFDPNFYDEYILNSAQGASHALFKAYGPVYMQVYVIFINQVFGLLSPQVPEHFQRISLYFLIDILEFAPSEFVSMESKVLPAILNQIESDDMEAVQLAVFTTGLLAQAQRQEYLNYLSSYMPVLYKLSVNPHKHDIERTVQCNAIAAIGRCLKFVPSLFPNPVGSLQEWLGFLPVLEDECDFVLDYVCELIENNINLVFRNDGSNTQHVLLSIFKMLFEVGPKVGKRAYCVIARLQSMDQNQIMMAVNSLDAVTRRELDLLMKDFAKM